MSKLFNKNIRSKLEEASYPFEDTAWKKMELLLDGKSETRPFFWWITGSLFSIVLLASGAMALSYYSNKSTYKNLYNELALVAEESRLPAINNANNATKTHVNLINENSSDLNKNSVSTKSKLKQLTKSNTTDSNQTTNSEDVNFYVAAFGADFFDIKLNKHDLTTLDKDNYFEKEKIRKKVAYQIGLHSFVGTSRVFNQNQSDNHKPLKPSYSIGVSNEVLLHEKWVLTTSIMYAKTVFRIINPDSYSIPLEFYDNSSHLIQIPIGVRFYPVSGKKINFYLTAGIINNLQIKETMQFYAKEPNQPIPAIEIPINSSSGTEELADFNSGNNTRLFNSTDEVANLYSVNQSSRYYMQIYTGVGVDIVAGKRMHFFAQPGFNYDLHKVGTQNKRVYQFGANTGLRWRF
jgi:hypothetical protein